MTVQKENNNFNIKTYYNFLNRDNYFLKASGKLKSKGYGGSCVGCTFKIIKTELSGNKHPEVRKIPVNRNPAVQYVAYQTEPALRFLRSK